jgi:hypothetical protein
MLPCNDEEAKILLRKWIEDSTPILLFIRARAFKSRNLSASCLVRLKALSGGFLEISLEPGGSLTLLLDGCTFGYSEPAEIGDPLRNSFKLVYRSTLVITFSPSLFITLSELTAKGQQQHGTGPRFML